jgi:hypothetical protein
MEPFNKIVLGTALVLLILSLAYMGVLMTYYKKKVPFPSVGATCPDYWTSKNSLDVNGNPVLTCSAGSGSVNAGYHGINSLKDPQGGVHIDKTGNGYQFTTTDAGWTKGGTAAICNQRNWAVSNGIEWDGVTNYNGCG